MANIPSANVSDTNTPAAATKQWFETDPLAGAAPPDKKAKQPQQQPTVDPSPLIGAEVPSPVPASSPPVEKPKTWYEGDPKVQQQTEFATQAGVAGRSLVSGLTRGSGMMAGASIGVTLGLMTGPLAPIAVPTLGTAGLVGGYLAGDEAVSGLAQYGLAEKNVEALPPNLRPTGIFFEGLGTGTTMIGQTMLYGALPGRLPDSAVGRVANSILDLARDKPIQFLAGEVPPLVTAVGTEAGFELAHPGHPLERTAAGVAAGVLNPARLVAKYGSALTLGLGKVATRLSEAGRQTKAGEVLLQFLDNADQPENPQIILKRLADTNEISKSIPGFRGTAAMTTGDQRLAQLEAELGERDRKFMSDATDMANKSLEAIANAIALLRGTGDQFALRAAAELKQFRYNFVLDNLLATSKREAVAAAEKMAAGGGPSERAALSVEASKVIYERSLKRANDIEEAMWEQAMRDFGDTPTGAKTVMRAFSSLKGEATSAIPLPSAIENSIADFARAQTILSAVKNGARELADGSRITAKMIKAATKQMSLRSIKNFRSDMLTLARGQSRTNQAQATKLERWYYIMAQAGLDDMTRAGVATQKVAGQQALRRGAAGQFTQDLTSFDEARMFSQAKGDTFERSFVGAAQQEGAYGLRIPPELMLKKAFATGEEQAVRQLHELEQATRLLPPARYQTPEILAQSKADTAFIMDAQERLLNIAANRFIKKVTDPETGKEVYQIDLTGARKFLDNNKDLFDRFPAVRDSFKEAISSKQKFDVYAQRIRGLKDHIDKGAIGRLLGVEDPVAAVRGALSSPKPVEALTDMARIAKSKGQAGLQGMRAAIFEHVIQRAETPDRNLGLGRLVDGLQEPVYPGGPSLRQFMETHGMLDEAGSKRLDELINAATRVMVGVQQRPTGEAVLDPTSALETLLVRATGSEIGRRALRLVQPEGAGASGPTLIVAYQAAKAAQDLVNRMPNAAVQQILINAMKGDPLQPAVGLVRRAAARAGVGSVPAAGKPWSLLDKLLHPGDTPYERIVSYEQLHAYAWQAGLLGTEHSYKSNQAQGDALSITTRDNKNNPQNVDAVATPASEATPNLQQPEVVTPQVKRDVAPGAATRGELTNNPGNLRPNGDAWRGAGKPEGGFNTFNSPKMGIRALARNLLSYQSQHNLRTVQAIIYRWAPPGENDTVQYIRHVAQLMGVRPDQPINLAQDKSKLNTLVLAIIKHENGRNIYDPKTIREGVEAAMNP